jgi:histidyl-tRNA synthetase
MASKDKKNRLKARLPRGFADRDAADIRAIDKMMEAIRKVYDRYGFDPVETPFIEYTDALGKFLPDQDRPNEGVFSFQDDDEQWLSLRYDLTAPLARHVAENYQDIAKPYRTYRSGWVFRNEKPGPGRFRQFLQFDADTVGAVSVAADAEMCMMAADVMEAVGIKRGDYVIRVNNRKVLDGVMEAIGIGGPEHLHTRLVVLRAIDKLDRLGVDGVRLLLGKGRKDESGDFTPGAGLDEEKINGLLELVTPELEFLEGGQLRPDAPMATWKPFDESSPPTDDEKTEIIDGEQHYQDVEIVIKKYQSLFDNLSNVGAEGADELAEILKICRAAGYGSRRIEISSSVVRGLEYYTGPVFETDLTFKTVNEKGKEVVFGSVGGGGRYDGLVGRFGGVDVPATGFSIGVSRLAAALKNLGKLGNDGEVGPVVVTVMDRDYIADYQKLATTLREAGIRAELYLGNPKNFGKQMQYADRRDAPCVVIQGTDERDRGVVQIKDLVEGKKKAAAIADNVEWREERPGQFEVREAELVQAVSDLLKRQAGA